MDDHIDVVGERGHENRAHDRESSSETDETSGLR